jgi:hypothetical protein
VITFTTTGPTFRAILTVTGSPIIAWNFGDGQTSSGADTGPITFTSGAATRQNTLTVNPWSALIAINVGYNGEDDGAWPVTAPATLAQQNVTAISGLQTAASLVTLSASHNPLTSLDVSNMTTLRDVECYYCPLTSFTLANNTGLKRLGIERAGSGSPQAGLVSLDLSQTPNLHDLRQAGDNTLASLNWGSAAAHSTLLHYCVRDDTELPASRDMSGFSALREVFDYNTGHSGSFVNHSGNLGFVYAYSNALTSVNVSNGFPNPLPTCFTGAGGVCGDLDVHQNQLTSLNIANSPGIKRLYAQQNNLGQTAVDSVLATLDGFGTSGGTVDLSSNTGPSATGLTHKAALEARGWTVTVDSTPTTATPTFSPSPGAYTGPITISDSTAGSNIVYCQDTTNTCTPSTAYSSPISFAATGYLRSQATASGYDASVIASGQYTVSGASTPTYVQSAHTTNGPALAYSSGVTSGNLLLAYAHLVGGGTTTGSFSDSAGNTWVDSGYGLVSGQGAGWVVMGYACVTHAGADTVILTTDANWESVQIYEFSHANCTIDRNAETINAATGSNGVESTPAITTTQADLVFAGFNAVYGPLSAGSGFTSPIGDVGGITEYLIQSAAGAATANVTSGHGAGESYSGIVLAFPPK